MRPVPWWIAALVRLYPPDYRARHGGGLAAELDACLARERTVAGRIGAVLSVCWDALSTRHSASSTPHLALSTGDPLMQSLLYDLRHAFRLLRRAPLFSALVVATLALAIGANTAIFSVVNTVLLRSLPYAEPDRLVLVYEGIGSHSQIGFSAPDLVAFRERTRSYDGSAAYRSVEFELSGIDQPERVSAARISPSLMDVLGVSPALGRTFTAEEDTGRQPVAILSDGLWRRAFGADRAVIGRTVTLDRRAYTIVGVMPARFSFPNRGPRLNNAPADVFVPISFSPIELEGFGMMYNNSVAARLKPGVTSGQAGAEALAVAKQILADAYPSYLRDNGFPALSATVAPMREEVVGNIRRLLVVLLAAVGVLLLIACADIACLMLTRAAARGREMAIRAALGAGRGRVMRLVLVETGVLAAAGGAAGLALAWWLKRALLASVSEGLPRAQEIGLDGRVLAFTAATSIAAAFVCGLLPALESSRHDSSGALKEGARGASAGARQRRIFSALVAAQFACAVVLLASGALLIRSFGKLIATDPGFQSDHVISASTSLPRASYPTGASIRAFYATLLERVAAMPGVTAAGAATDLPLTVRERRSFTVENPPQGSAGSGTIANDWVTGQYFDALGARVIRGRALGPSDTQTSEPVLAINETLAKRYFPGQDPVNRLVAWGGAKQHGPWMRVVGVMADVKQAGLANATEPQTWQPWSQVPDGMVANNPTGIFRSLKLMVRSSVPPASLVPAIRAEVARLDPALPVTGVQTLDEIVGASAAAQRFNAVLLGGFAGVALLLAAVGIGGVLAISVSRRTQEIGIRMALGANVGEVVRMVVRQGMALVLAGLVLGLPAAFAATRLLRTLLFEIAPSDPVSFAAATAILCIVALAACAAPALRASRVNPIAALRID
jgi:putative ABC transport system permease protein